MKGTLLRHGLTFLVFAVALLNLGSGARSQGGEHINLLSFHYGVSTAQYLRTCLSNPAPTGSVNTESISLTYQKIIIEHGQTVLENEFRIPSGEFRCVDLTYSDLLNAGIQPDSSGRLQFFLAISREKKSSIGVTEQITVGAAQSINVSSGKTESYQPIRSR